MKRWWLLDTLSSSELNQQVINSVKQTSSALKSMGLGDALKQADGLHLDMEEQISDIESVQKSLATPLYDDFDDLGDGLEAELDLLLKDSDDEITACLAAPTTLVATVNSMENPTAAPAPPAGAEAARPEAARPEAAQPAPDEYEEAEPAAGTAPSAKKKTGRKAKGKTALERVVEHDAEQAVDV